MLYVSYLKFLFTKLASYQKYQFFCLTFAIVLVAAGEFLSIYLIGQLAEQEYAVFDFIAQIGYPIEQPVLIVVSLFLIMTIARWFLLALQTRFSYRLGVRLSVELLSEKVDHFSNGGGIGNSGDVVSTFVYRTKAVVTGVLVPFFQIISYIPMLLASLVAVYTIFETEFVIYLVPLAGLIVLTLLYIAKALSGISHQVSVQNGEVLGTLTEIVQAGYETNNLGVKSHAIEKFRKRETVIKDNMAKAAILIASPRHVMEIALLILVASIYLWNGGANDTFNKQLVLFLVASVRIIPMFSSLITAINTWNISKGSVIDFFASYEKHAEIGFAKSSLNELQVGKLTNSYRKLDKKSEGVTTNQHQRVSFNVKPGSPVLLSGESGIGKSKLLKNIAGIFQPLEGEIKLPNGHGPSDVYLISQSPTFFFGSCFDNIVGFKKELSSADSTLLLFACRVTGVFDEIGDIEKLKAIELGNGNSSLSGGQLQRVALARAILANKSIYLFDECTSNLDEDSAKQIMLGLTDWFSDKFVLVVSHQPVYSELKFDLVNIKRS